MMAVRPISNPRRLTCAVAVAALAALTLPQSVSAYHFIYERSGTTYLPVSWGTLPISFILDQNVAGTAPNFRTSVRAAFTVWNNVATAKDMFSNGTDSAVDFTGANYGTAWGVMPADGDGNHEVVCDADGTALAAVGSAGALGRAMRQHKIVSGQARIVDGLFILNCQTAPGADFDHVGTMVHEFGHVLGLRHSSAYLPDTQNFPSFESTNMRLEPLAIGDAPTMYPYAIPGNDAASATLEADDIAGISHLYPETTFNTSYGTITGTVTRCGGTEAVSGVNVRAVSTSDAKVQITRYTGYDGNTTGSYEIKVPPGTYHLIIEVMTLPVNSMGMLTTVANDFTTEYLSNATEENDCTEELPDSATNVTVGAGDEGLDVIGAMVTANQNFKTNPVELAFVVDDTGSMGPEISAVRTTLTNEIARLAASGRPFPNTALITFKDGVTHVKTSRDSAVLQTAVNGLTASGGGDCPEHSNDALLMAGRMLRRGGKSMLFTDADSHPSGATAGAVSSLYTSKSLRMSVLLSGMCSGSLDTASDGYNANMMNPAFSQNPDAPASDRLPTEPTLGFQTSVETNAAIVAATGGMFVAIPGIKTGSTTERTRYINTGTNIAVSAAGLPTVGLVTPGDGPRGATFDVEINGSNTNFQGSSVVSFSGSGITVNSRTIRSATQIIANITVASDAATGFRDVTVTTSIGTGVTETATGVGAFNIVTALFGARVVSVSPSSGGLGQTRTVTISGVNTSFSAASVPIFCAGFSCSLTSHHDSKIVVNTVTAVNSTTLDVNITIAGDATVSFRSVSVITGTQVANESQTGPFLVTPPALAIPTITAVSPTSGIRGQTLTVVITGETTNFVNGTSVVSFSGTGITVNTTTVSSPTSATANITIAGGATLGFRDVFVTTNGETAALINGFNVTDPPTAEAATGLYAASVAGNMVTLRWTPPAFGLVPTGYVLEGGINPGEILASLPTGSTNPIFTFTAPTGAFYVRIHTMAGAIRSAASNEIRIFVNMPSVAPSSPTKFTGMVSGSSVAFSWQNTFAGGEPSSVILDVTGSRTASLPLAPGESATFTGAPSGTYTFRLRTANAGGASAASAPITMTVPTSCTGVPQAPSDFLAYKLGNTIYVVWNPPAGGPAATGYALVVTGAFNLSVPTAARSMFGTVPPGTYNLSVRATNACGNGATTAVQTIVIP